MPEPSSSSAIHLGQFCGASPFWDLNVSWRSSHPDLTTCFRDTIPVWIPAAFLLVSLPTRLNFTKHLGGSCQRGGLIATKIVLLSIVFCSTATELALRVWSMPEILAAGFSSVTDDVADYVVSPAYVINHLLMLATIFVVFLLTLRQRFLRDPDAAAVLFFFWLLHFLLQLLRLQHHARVANGVIAPLFVETENYFAATVYVATAASAASVAASAIGAPRSSASSSSLDAAGPASWWTLWWVFPTILRGFRKPLTMSDLEDLPEDFKVDRMMRKFYGKDGRDDDQKGEKNKEQREKVYVAIADDIETQTKDFLESEDDDDDDIEDIDETWNFHSKKSISFSLFASNIRHFLNLVVMRSIFVGLELAKPAALGWLLHHLSNRPEADDEEWRWKAIFFVVVVFVICAFLPFVHDVFWWWSSVLGLKVKNIALVAVFDKSLRVSAGRFSVGDILNLVAVDVARLHKGFNYLVMGLLIPFHLAFSAWMLEREIGVAAAAAGFACLAALLPLNVVVVARVKGLQLRHMTVKDERVRLVTEMLMLIKALKLYAWEPAFLQRVTDVRKREMGIFRRQMIWQSIAWLLFNAAPVAVSVVALLVFAASSSSPLTAERAFVSLALLNGIRFPLWLLPFVYLVVVQMVVSGKRLDEFFAEEEIDISVVRSLTFDDHDSAQRRNADSVRFHGASFAWRGGAEPCLKNISFEAKAGAMTAIVGEVGAGKSALLKAMLGELVMVEGSAAVTGKVAYVAQQPWIRNATVKENILFGRVMDRPRYEAVLDACALLPDLAVLPAGDETEIGERGVTLSGGQKLRVSLARAVYADADLVLLDDPLAAVDAHVGRIIFERVLSSDGLLGGKTRVVVTHAVNYLPRMDRIVRIQDGKIVSSSASNLDEDISYDNERYDVASEDGCHRMFGLVQETGVGKLTHDEEGKVGGVGFAVFSTYLASAGWLVSMVTMAAFVGTRALEMAAAYRLSRWTDDLTALFAVSSNNASTNSSFGAINSTLEAINAAHAPSFAILGAVSSLCYVVAGVGRVLATFAASRRLHDRLARRVVALPSAFFDATPLGRIVNRFASDIDAIDFQIPEHLFNVYNSAFYVIAALVLIAGVKPWFFLIVPLLVVCVVATQRFYIRAARQLRRLESVSKSPIFSLVGETMQGATVIRAFNAEGRFRAECRRLVEAQFKTSFLKESVDEWMTFVLEITSAFFVLCIGLVVVLREDTTPGQAGLTIGYAISVAHILVESSRYVSNLQNALVAVERVTEYSRLPTEAPWRTQGSNESLADWPKRGEVRFRGYSAKYRGHLEPALRNLDFTIDAGERVGVVGRTGAGKTSLALSLFRVFEASSGRVEIDGRDVAGLGLHDLRSKISVIPQDPVLFSGTIASNLDPTRRRDETDLRRALNLARLENLVTASPEGLDRAVAESGADLSVGQRQLVCLARALLRNSKILVLDEATAAVDAETDAFVRKTIREEFVDATVISIAHRLDSVLDCDRVLVMSRGQVVEFDDPRVLMEDPGSEFYALAKDAGLVGGSSADERVGEA